MQSPSLVQAITQAAQVTSTPSALVRRALKVMQPYLGTRLINWCTLNPWTLQPNTIYFPINLNALPFFKPARRITDSLRRFDADKDRPFSLHWMIRNSHVAATLHNVYNGDLEKSGRLSRPELTLLGIKDELRLLLQHNQQTWGVISAIHRKRHFTQSEVKMMRTIGPLLGDATRASFVHTLTTASPSEDTAPGVLMMDRKWCISESSREADRLLGDETTRGMPMWLDQLRPSQEVAAPPSLVVLTSNGPVTAHSSNLNGKPLVFVERSKPMIIAELLMRTYGLSLRERQVVAAVFRGWPTRKIAFELDIADWTVQDHLKSVFSKVGVKSRLELTSHLLFSHSIDSPHTMSAAGTSG